MTTSRGSRYIGGFRLAEFASIACTPSREDLEKTSYYIINNTVIINQPAVHKPIAPKKPLHRPAQPIHRRRRILIIYFRIDYYIMTLKTAFALSTYLSITIAYASLFPQAVSVTSLTVVLPRIIVVSAISSSFSYYSFLLPSSQISNVGDYEPEGTRTRAGVPPI